MRRTGVHPLLPCVVVLTILCAFTRASADADKVRVLAEGPGAGHFLCWRGKPLLLCGDSITQGWMECGRNLDQVAYVDALAERGINLLMLWAFKGTSAAIQQRDARLGYDAPEIMPWCGSADRRDFDLHRFNDEYFSRLRGLVTHAERRAIVVLVTVHDGWPKTCFDGHPFHRALGNGPLDDKRQYVELAHFDREMPATFSAAWNRAEQNQYFQERFCERLIAELNSCSNVLYEMCNEGEWYDAALRHQHEQHFLAFFRRRCTNVLLSNSDHIRHDTPHADDKVDVITLHPRDWVGHFADFAAGFGQVPPKPYLYSEPVPEFDGQQPTLDVVRQSMWETLLAGAGWVNQNDPSFGWDPRAAIASQRMARDRAYDLAGHCARFFKQSGIAFWRLTPHGELCSTGVCSAQPGTEYVAYAPSGGSFTMDLSHAGDAVLRARWYNPRKGEFRDAALIGGGSARQSFTPPWPGDAVLHLVRCDGSSPAAGRPVP